MLILVHGKWFSAAFLTLVFGPPIAFLVVWTSAAPALRWLLAKPLSYPAAALWGGIIAVGIVLLDIIFQENTYAYLSDLNIAIFVQDGVLTTFDWRLVIQNSALFIAKGICVALLVRHFIGPGDSKT
jgi:hypothetical protein